MATEDWEDVGGDMATRDFEEVNGEPEKSMRHMKRTPHPHNPTKRQINKLAHQIHDLRNQKKEIEGQLKELTNEVIDLMDLENVNKIYTDDFCVSLSTKVHTTVDRHYLHQHYPAAYKKVVKSGTISTSVYIKAIRAKSSV